MLPHILGNHIKVILVLVSHRAYHVPCADVKAEYQRYPFQLLLHFIQFPFLLDCLGNLIKRFFPCAIIFNHHLAVFPVFAVRKLAPEHAFHLFLGIAPGAHQAFFPDFLRGADIPQLVADFPVIFLNQQGGFNNHIVQDSHALLLCNLP